MLRTTLAVVTGYLLFAISAALFFQFSGQDPHAAPSAGFAVAGVAWGVFFAALGGYTAAATAQRPDLLPGIAIATLIAIGALASLAAEQQGSKWTQWCTLLLIAPSAVGGAVLHRRLKSIRKPG